MKTVSIRRRLVLTLSGTFIALYVITALFVHTRMRQNLMGQLDRHVSSKLADFVAETTIDRNGLHASFHDLNLPEFGERSKSGYYQLFDANNNTVLRSRSLPESWHLSQVVPIGKKGSQVVPTVLPDGRHARIKTASIEAPGLATNYTLTLAEDATPAEKEIAEIGGTLLAGGVLMGLGCVSAVILVVRWMSKPILRLADHAAAFDLQRLRDRLPIANVPEELLPLVTQFNTLLDRLSEAVEHERRFTAAMAHELRTPISELQVLSDVALSELGDHQKLSTPPLEKAEVYRLSAGLAQRLTRLVEVMSALHRAESGRQLLWIQALDLNQLVASRIEWFQPLAKARAIKMEFHSDASSEPQKTDQVLFTAVTDNLLSNAIEHSADGSTLVIRLGQTPSGIRLEISNPAPDLTAADLEHFEEAFWQKDSSRTKPNCFGLGLALTRSYADLLKATLSFSMARGFLSVVWAEPAH